MSEYLIQSETLDDIADAINAKTGGSSAMTPAEMATAIGTISGGGSLPSVISKLDGGSFTLASNTLTGNYNVPHNLGVAPTGVAVWSEDVTADSSVRVEAAYMVYSDRYFVAQLNTNGSNRDIIATVPSGDLSANSFKTTVSANYYKAGATYKWLAWAWGGAI